MVSRPVAGDPAVLLVERSTAACAAAVASFVRGDASVVLGADEADLLPEALAAAARGFAVLSPRVAEGARAMPALSSVERRLLELVGAGASTVDLADQLRCSPATAKREVARLAGRFGVDGRAGLMAVACDLGL